MQVINSVDPIVVPASEKLDARLLWVGLDDRGIELEIVALNGGEVVIVIHVMPTSLRR